MGAGPMMFMMPGALEDLYENAGFDEAQRKQAEELMAKSREQFREVMQNSRPSPEEMEKMRAMREEMRAAREAGDRAKLEQLSNDMREMFAARRAAQDKFAKDVHDGLKAIARPDQAEKFDSAWKEMESARPGQFGRVRNVRDLRRAVMALDLSKEQKDAIEPIFEEYNKQRRDRTDDAAGSGGKTADSEAAALKEVREKVEQHLTDAQKKKLDQRLQAGSRERGGRRGRPGGPRGDGPPTDEPPPPPPGQ